MSSITYISVRIYCKLKNFCWYSRSALWCAVEMIEEKPAYLDDKLLEIYNEWNTKEKSKNCEVKDYANRVRRFF
jgi:hypothetical protein